jgi:hypothetical protein
MIEVSAALLFTNLQKKYINSKAELTNAREIQYQC